MNGGSQAIIVRVHNGAKAATLSLPTTTESTVSESLQLEAADVGSWGNKLKASVNYETRDTANLTLFNLTVREDKEGGTTENFANVSVDPLDPRYLPELLKQSSLLVRVTQVPEQRPTATKDAAVAAVGSDGDPIGVAELSGQEDQKTGL